MSNRSNSELSAETYNKLAKITSHKPSSLLKRVKEIAENGEWYKHSMRIATDIVCALSEQNMTQKDLAKKLNVTPQQVNKYVKGKENLTLKTISEIEKALNIEIIFKKEVEELDEYMYHI